MRGRQLVWSDERVRELSREFVTVADEAYMLYPEHEAHLRRVADRPQHRFFRRYGEAMPEGDWHHPGTKQGLYMIGPDAEYLEGRFAASGFPDDVVERLERALARWDELRAQKGYANEPVPAVASTLPPELERAPFVLRVHSRDLPRDGGTRCVRFDVETYGKASWRAFTDWAWNENWLAVADGGAFVPAGEGEQAVEDAVVQRIATQVLIDNVRGQAGTWPTDAVRSANMTMRRGATADGVTAIVYRGEVDLDDGERTMRLRLYGEGSCDAAGRLRAFELVALGVRTGAHRFNGRRDDPGPAPIGFALTRWTPPEASTR